MNCNCCISRETVVLSLCQLAGLLNCTHQEADVGMLQMEMNIRRKRLLLELWLRVLMSRTLVRM